LEILQVCPPVKGLEQSRRCQRPWKKRGKSGKT